MRYSSANLRRSLPAISAILSFSLLAAACGPATGQPEPAPPTTNPTAEPAPTEPPAGGVEEARSALARDLAPAAAQADVTALAASNRGFAFDLYQALREADGNLFSSPHSISLALAMTYAGARGDTESQMAGALHFDLPQAQLHPAFNALDLSLDGPETDGQPFTLEIANSIWGQNGYPFEPAFLDTLAVNYGAGLRLVDFVEPGNREAARLAINDWVSGETAGKIPELLGEGILTELTRLVLANAIYFKGDWEEPFPTENTQEASFFLLDGSQVSVPFMSRRAMTGYAEGSGYQAVELAYKGGRARMLVLLPAEGEFEAFEQGLDAAQVQAILGAMQPADIELQMPKFSYDSSFMLKDALAGLGMPDAFDENRADFSGIAPIPPRLALSAVVHKAFVAVDEKGTEAAAATGVVVGIVSLPQPVTIDRPFVYLIYDAETGAVLFLGRVLNPGT